MRNLQTAQNDLGKALKTLRAALKNAEAAAKREDAPLGYVLATAMMQASPVSESAALADLEWIISMLNEATTGLE